MNIDALKEIEQGHYWEVKSYASNNWGKPKDYSLLQAVKMLANGLEIRLADWKLPEPPSGQEWYRNDGWNHKVLPKGYRPLVKGEIVPALHTLILDKNGQFASGKLSDTYVWFVTNVPFKIEVPKPLTPDHFPPGTAVRKNSDQSWHLVCSVFETGISFNDISLKFEHLMFKYEYFNPNTKTWHPCYTKQLETSF